MAEGDLGEKEGVFKVNIPKGMKKGAGADALAMSIRHGVSFLGQLTS